VGNWCPKRCAWRRMRRARGATDIHACMARRRDPAFGKVSIHGKVDGIRRHHA
jgi:hypothetical protein